jgi:sulfur relay (sulfurtransferase) complex TusBCD TusD component (DsrE family)
VLKKRFDGNSLAIIRTCPGAIKFTENIFFTTDQLTPERLSWLVELIKYYTARLHPESLHHHPRVQTSPFSFFITGDACYSLIDRRCLHYWEILLSLPPFQCICDSKELKLRGISVEPLKIRFPGQILTTGQQNKETGREFWDTYFDTTVVDSVSRSLGVLLLESPYMHRSPWHLVHALKAAMNRNLSPELYMFADGIHSAHRDQKPVEFDNIGDSLDELGRSANNMGLSPLFLACSRCATTRGYSTFMNEKGNIVSSCTIPAMKIRRLEKITERFKRDHQIISHSSFAIQAGNAGKSLMYPKIKKSKKQQSPPLVILAAGTPYGTEMTFDAISFALAHAFQDIPTRVVFIEDGVYSMWGKHVPPDNQMIFNMQEVINATRETNNLEFFSYIPSLQQRGLVSRSIMENTLPIGSADLGRILFELPVGTEAPFQRVMIF